MRGHRVSRTVVSDAKARLTTRVGFHGLWVWRLAAAVLVAVPASPLTAAAQCSCGPVFTEAFGYPGHLEISFIGDPPEGIVSRAIAAANQWNSKNSQTGAPGSIAIVSSASRRVAFDVPDGSAGWSDDGSTLHMPTNFLVPGDNPPTNAYVQALFLHEFGHPLGWGQAPCSNSSVMSNTNAGSYRTDFTACDEQQFAYFFGTPSDPCAGACPAVDMCPPEQERGYDECGCPTCYSPIFLQLDSGGVEFSSAHDGVLFDMYGRGELMRVAWPVSQGTAWLAMDRNHNGKVDDGTELFGNTRLLQSGSRPISGYDVLAELDANGDGVLNDEDPSFDDLLLWRDRDRDGRSRADELDMLRSGGILALHLDARESRRVDRWGNVFRYRAKVDCAMPPRERFSWDVFLTVERSRLPIVPQDTSDRRK